MSVRRLPVRPDIDQLHREAKELLRDIHAGDPLATSELHELHPESIDPTAAKLADAQLVLARRYRASNWTRLVQAVQLADAIWRDDALGARMVGAKGVDPNAMEHLLGTDSRNPAAKHGRYAVPTVTL